jgi:hypothetical protein
VTRLGPDECAAAIRAVDWSPHPSTSAFRTFDPIRTRAGGGWFEVTVGTGALPGPALPESLALRGRIAPHGGGSVVETWYATRGWATVMALGPFAAMIALALLAAVWSDGYRAVAGGRGETVAPGLLAAVVLPPITAVGALWESRQNTLGRIVERELGLVPMPGREG